MFGAQRGLRCLIGTRKRTAEIALTDRIREICKQMHVHIVN